VGVTGITPIDQLGILVKEGKTAEHYSKVLEMLKSSKIFIENKI
jgi:hypothetical protein